MEEEITEEEIIYNKIIKEIEYIMSLVDTKNPRIYKMIEYLELKLKELTITNFRGFLYYYYQKALLFLFYSESDYKEDFEDFLDEYLYEISFEKDCLKKLYYILNKMVKVNDYLFLKNLYVNIISIEKIQVVRFACLNKREEILYNSRNFINYIPNDDINLTEQEFMDKIETDTEEMISILTLS